VVKELREEVMARSRKPVPALEKMMRATKPLYRSRLPDATEVTAAGPRWSRHLTQDHTRGCTTWGHEGEGRWDLQLVIMAAWGASGFNW